MGEKRKPLYWEASSKRDFKAFPIAVQKDLGVAPFIVQLGSTPPSAKPLKGFGAGVFELRDDHRGDTFRAVYAVKIGDAVHVLHAFKKKSKSGIAHAEVGHRSHREKVEDSSRPPRRKREDAMKRKDARSGIDNVLEDLGFDDAEELSTKAALALRLNALIEERGLTQAQAATVTGMTQPKISQVRRYKLRNISLERLMQALVALDQRVEIKVQPARHAHAAGITVAR
jgi:phage-related protein/predicted XRE-type DNA-binding protein